MASDPQREERMNKKYYWLKLNIDFFDREEIKLIEGMPNGKDYIIFYMKLLLKSTNTNGRLMFKDIIPYTDEMLATITNTNIDVIRSAVKMFIQLGLMDKLDDGALFMLETQNMIGSETEYAKKKREYREKMKQGLLENKTMDNTETKKDIVRQEKEIELDKEIDINNTHTGEAKKEGTETKEENPKDDPVIIQQILKKYKELGLPEYEYRPDNYVILEAYNNLGVKKLLEALKIMSESEFVKNNMSVNSIFKLDNLKKARNRNFKDKEKKKIKDESKEFKKPEYKDFTGDFIDDLLSGKVGGAENGKV